MTDVIARAGRGLEEEYGLLQWPGTDYVVPTEEQLPADGFEGPMLESVLDPLFALFPPTFEMPDIGAVVTDAWEAIAGSAIFAETGGALAYVWGQLKWLLLVVLLIVALVVAVVILK